MSKETITRLIDDLDGGAADRTVSFAWDGRTYEIDLSKKNSAALEKALKPYLSAARTASSRSARRGGGRSAVKAAPRANLQEIRDWARANGHEVSDRGRIASSVVAAYEGASQT